MALNVKAFLEKNGDVKGEIRRFQVPSDCSNFYRLLTKKVAEVFSLPENVFQLYWQDTDGDFVTFSSLVEMMEAVHHSTDGVLRIFVKRTTDQDKDAEDKGGEPHHEEKVHHPGIVCDGCEENIYGPRYKCVICPDYDLCAACEQKGLHPEHDKFKITHPQTAGGHGGFMPPHFRRWMHRFMKKCPAGYGQCPAGGASATGQGTNSGGGESTTGAQSQGPSEPEYEFLNNIGANIAAFMDPFGVDVTYEVRHGEEEKKGHFKTNDTGTGTWDQSGGPGVWHWGMFGNAGGCTRMPQAPRPSASSKGEKPAEKSAEKSTKEAAEQAAPEETRAESAMEELPVTVEEESAAAPKTQDTPAVPKTQDTPRSREASPTGSHEDDWTMLNDGETATDGQAAPATESAPCEGLYPNLKVTQAVEMMKAMGFNDDGGWLTHLLETTDGDIARALDTLKLGAQQASQLS